MAEKPTLDLEQLATCFAYLVRLRDSGRTNMWGAPEFLVNEMGLERAEAERVFFAWRDTVDPLISNLEQARRVLHG